MKQQNSDRKRLDYQRSQAARYFCKKYSREQRYLIIFERDFEKYLSSADYLKTKDTKNQFYFDFLGDYQNLLEKMKEFKWNKDFLKKNGIRFEEIRKLYFTVA